MNDFLLNSLIAGISIGISFSLIGVIIVLKRMSFIGAGLSHSAFAGVSLALILKLPTMLITFLYNSLCSIFIYKFRGIKNEDALVGVIFSFSMAFAISLIYMGNITSSITQILFGDILTITQEEVLISLFSLIILLSFFYKKGKEFVYFSFDEDYLKVKGFNTNFMYLASLLLISFLITISIKMIGILLVSSFLVLPPLSSLMISKNVRELFVFSSLFSVLSVILGLFSSLLIDVPASSLIVMTSSVMFLISHIYSNKIMK